MDGDTVPLFASPSPVDSYSLFVSLLMMMVDVLWMLLLTFYLDVVYTAHGAPSLPPWFLCMPSFWRGDEAKSKDDVAASRPLTEDEVAFEKDEEMEAMDMDIELQGLTKDWSDGWWGKAKKRVVDGLSLVAHPGQVTALLGHTGAGKSTTFAMLTGLTRPTLGDTRICQHSVRSDGGMAAIRKLLGVCPQYDVVVERLTVHEHLKLFCRLKNRRFNPEEAQMLLATLELSDKVDCLAGKLSGAMKRKLSMCIALIGGSEVVVLDDPTVRMDSRARQHTWMLIQKEKRGRTMLLTTHYMEKADLLGDRIVILVGGRHRCSGSPLELKTDFGGGYGVTLVLSPMALPQAILTNLQQYCPNAAIQSASEQEVTFRLPIAAMDSYRPMFAQLESQQQALGISSFGVLMAPTLKEVYMKVGDDDDGEDQSDASQPSAAVNMSLPQSIAGPMHTGHSLVIDHLKAMMTKCLIYTLRHWPMLIAQLLIPVVIFVCAMMFAGRTTILPPLELTPTKLVDGKFLLQATDVCSALTKIVEELVKNTAGWNLRRIPNVCDGLNNDYFWECYQELGFIKGNFDMVIGAMISKTSVTALHNSAEAYHASAVALCQWWTMHC